MIWENCDSFSAEANKNTFIWSNQQDNHTSATQLAQNKIIQLKKFQDPSNSTERQAYIHLASRFGELIVDSNFEEILRSLLTDDCQFYLFSSTGRPLVLYTLQPEGIYDIYTDIRIQERIVRETYVDLEKSTIVQISSVKVLYQDEESPADEFVIEIFTIRNDRISKYRASFGRLTAAHGDCEPFALSRKDIALGKVKHMNYALAGTPDLNKVASFFCEKTQYKIWSWESQKHFIFGKHDFADNFRKIEGNLRIESIVPYEIYAESEFMIGTYVYHLEEITDRSKKYIWATTCIFTFDNDLNIIKINQQGELHPEDDVEISFEVFSRERIVKVVRGLNENAGTKISMDVLYHDIVQSTCQSCKFGAENLPDVGFFKGLDQAKRLMAGIEKGCAVLDWSKIGDFYIDSSGDTGYDVAILVSCNQGILNYPGYKYNGEYMNTIHFIRVWFENGTVSRNMAFSSEIIEPIPSFFDDEEFQAINIIRRSDII